MDAGEGRYPCSLSTKQAAQVPGKPRACLPSHFSPSLGAAGACSAAITAACSSSMRCWSCCCSGCQPAGGGAAWGCWQAGGCRWRRPCCGCWSGCKHPEPSSSSETSASSSEGVRPQLQRRPGRQMGGAAGAVTTTALARRSGAGRSRWRRGAAPGCGSGKLDPKEEGRLAACEERSHLALAPAAGATLLAAAAALSPGVSIVCCSLPGLPGAASAAPGATWAG